MAEGKKSFVLYADLISVVEKLIEKDREDGTNISGESTISDIKRKRFAEVLLNDRGDRYYKARLQYLTLDEKSGTEKKTNVNMLVQASSLREALRIVEKEMDKTMIEYVIHTISETPIMDLFPYKSENDE